MTTEEKIKAYLDEKKLQGGQKVIIVYLSEKMKFDGFEEIKEK